MSSNYDDAVASLYRVALDDFVAERKRLATGLIASGDKAGGTRLSRLRRPSVPAWAVNQLWWHAREAFEHLLERAARLRQGDLDAADGHRKALAALRARAAKLLGDAGHAANEATLRRVTTTLAALAVAGNFDPDPPGALGFEREPPGFDAFGDAPLTRTKPTSDTKKRAPAAATAEADDETTAKHAAQERAAAVAEAQRVEKERARRAAETRAAKQRLQATLRSAQDKLELHERDLQQLRHELSRAEAKFEAEQNALKELEERLAALGDD